jgi:hypothetical protein
MKNYEAIAVFSEMKKNELIELVKDFNRSIQTTTFNNEMLLTTQKSFEEKNLKMHEDISLAIAKLAGMVKSAAARGTQVIMATQSVDLINYFDAEDIVTVDQINGESQLKRFS